MTHTEVFAKGFAREIAQHVADIVAQPQRLLTKAQAAKYLGVSKDTVNKLIACGELRTVDVRCKNLDRKDLDNYIELNKN